MSNVGAEVAVLDEWVEAVCASSAAITGEAGDRVFSELAPADAVYPFVVYQTQSTTDLHVVGPDRLLTEVELLIRGVSATSSYTPLKPLAKAIDLAFHGTVGTTDGSTISCLRRTRQFKLVEQYEGSQVRHLGGIYRVWVQG